MALNPLEAQRYNLSKDLIDPTLPPRAVPAAEEQYVASLLNETPATPERSVQTQIGRRALIGAETTSEALDPQVYAADKRDNLERSREVIRNNVLKGIDDAAVDEYLGLRKEKTILPPLLRDLHQKSEEKAGHDISFLEWMTDYATDEQLTNVWQWHDTYLTDLDQDPAFQEQVAAVKHSYMEGLGLAIDEGALHPGMAIDEAQMDKVRIVHGSPLSPTTASGDANADAELSLVQVREGVSEYVLHHELTHLFHKGLLPELEEGGTELITAAIYDRTHPDEPIDLSASAYADQIATLNSLKRISDGRANLYWLSGAYAGADELENTLTFTNIVDDVVGMPVSIALIKSSQELVREMIGQARSNIVIGMAHRVMKERTEFIEAMLADSGHGPARTVGDLVSRMLSDETRGAYDTNTIVGGIRLVHEMAGLQTTLTMPPTETDVI